LEVPSYRVIVMMMELYDVNNRKELIGEFRVRETERQNIYMDIKNKIK
jgi:hypothetical protein